MSFLQVGELASIQQAVAAAVCDQSCQIERASITYGVGGATVTWPVVSPPGLLAGMGEPMAGGALSTQEYHLGDKAVWKVRFPVGTDVRELDRLVIAGRTLSVAKLLTPRSYAALVSVLATE